MHTVTAYKSERSGRLHYSERDARREEFEWLMKDAGKWLPSIKGNRPYSNEDLMEWMSEALTSGTYGSAYTALHTALSYLADNYKTITGKDEPPISAE